MSTVFGKSGPCTSKNAQQFYEWSNNNYEVLKLAIKEKQKKIISS
jgi:hypothetical protein